MHLHAAHHVHLACVMPVLALLCSTRHVRDRSTCHARERRAVVRALPDALWQLRGLVRGIARRADIAAGGAPLAVRVQQAERFIWEMALHLGCRSVVVPQAELLTCCAAVLMTAGAAVHPVSRVHSPVALQIR